MELLEQRDKEIVELRKNRYKLEEIGNKYGITKERVRQIVLKEKERELRESNAVDKPS